MYIVIEGLFLICFVSCIRCTLTVLELVYTNIDPKRRNLSHGPIHYKIGVFSGHEINTLL